MDQPAQIINEPVSTPVAINSQPQVPSQKPSKIPLILLVVLIVGLVGAAAFWLGKSSSGPKIVVTPTPTAIPTLIEATPTLEVLATPTPDLTAAWKTYINTRYGYLIKYPGNFEFLGSMLMEDFIVDFTWIKEDIGHKPGISVRVINAVGPAWSSVRDYFEKQFLNKNISISQGDKGKTTILEKTQLDGAEAVKQIEETIPGAGTENFYALCVYAFRSNRVYKLCNYASDKETALKKEEIFNLMLSTFRFVD